MGALPRTLRPRLRSDVRFVQSADGVYIHSDYGTCTLRGRHAYQWLARLAPVLDGSRTLTELTAALPDDKRAMVEQIVQSLLDNRFAVDDRARAGTGDAVGTAEAEIYADEIAFIGYLLDAPEERFQWLRRAETVVLGDGPLLPALLEALACSGWRRLRVVSSGTQGLVEAFSGARRDPGQQIEVQRLDLQQLDWVRGDADAAVHGADLVIQVSQDVAALADLCRTLHGSGGSLAQALVRPAEVWLSPAGRPDATAAESGWRRLAALSGAEPRAGQDLLIGPAPAVVAGMLTLSCFSHLTGLDTAAQDAAPAMSRVDLQNLDTRVHRFLPHPSARAAERDEAADLVHGPLAADEALARARLLVDERLGAVATLDEGALTQFPLSVCRAEISDPYRVLPSWAPPPEAVGWGVDRPTARLRTLLGAVATYGFLAVPRSPDGSAVVPGVDLLTGEPRSVPLDAVPGGRTRFRAPLGAGAGLSREAALTAGLRAHVEALLGDREPAVLPAVRLPDSEPGRLLAATGERVEARDATAVLGVPAFWFLLDGVPRTVSAAPTAELAMNDGLERLLLYWQSRTERQPVYGRVRPLWCDTGGAPDAVRLMAEALGKAGWTPVAVQLDHDPEVARVLPHVTAVVLCDG